MCAAVDEERRHALAEHRCRAVDGELCSCEMTVPFALASADVGAQLLLMTLR